MGKLSLSGIFEGHKIQIFRSLQEPVESSFVYAIFPECVITSQGTVLTPDSNVSIHVSGSLYRSFPVTQAAVDAKIKKLCFPGDIPNPPSEPE